jgi:hypothetical protein
MDNGLIFPYRQSSAHDEPGDANHPTRVFHFCVFDVGGGPDSVGPEPVVVKRWGDAGRQPNHSDGCLWARL